MVMSDDNNSSEDDNEDNDSYDEYISPNKDDKERYNFVGQIDEEPDSESTILEDNVNKVKNKPQRVKDDDSP